MTTKQLTTWSEADTEALVELYSTCTVAQLSAYLDKDERPIMSKISSLRKQGYFPPREKQNHSLVPWCCPQNGVMIAKTCFSCGLLKEAKYYRVEKKGKKAYLSSRCKNCLYEAAGGIKRVSTTDSLAYYHALQEVTRETATKHREPWTGPDFEVLENEEKTHFQVALEINRTYASVRSMRRGIQVKRKNNRDKHWLIHFPKALEALQEHFRFIGKPVPEELWEW